MGIGTEPVSNISLKLNREVSGTGYQYGINSKLNAAYGTFMRCRYIGIFGGVETDTVAPTPAFPPTKHDPVGYFKVGVCGMANHGVAIYGTNKTTIPLALSGKYAGYFNGDVKSTGTITASTIATTSDLRLKENVKELTEAYKIISQLSPVSFTFKPDTNMFSYDAKSQEMQNTHYGLIAQELKEVLPNVVYENSDGFLSVNYTELIPLLIQSIKDLHSEIEFLKTEKENAYKISAKNNQHNYIEATLYQNQPNPFSQSTEIKYSLPIETTSATLYIYDMSGVQLRSYPISKFGDNSLTLNANDLTAGMYLYSLIADGQVIDTKRMILTK